MGKGEWYQVTGQHFSAGIEVKEGNVVRVPPVLAWVLMRRDRSFEWLKSYAAAHGWGIGRLVVIDGGVRVEPVIARGRRPKRRHSETARE